VRAFAARRLGETDTAPANRRLIELLEHEDTEVREIAAGSLAAHKKAATLLLGALAQAGDAEAAWRLAKILKPHGGAVSGKALRPFAAKAGKALLAGDPLAEPLLYFLRNADPKTAEAAVLGAGLAHRRAHRYAEAVACLRRLIGTEAFDDEVRYALSVCNLKLSPKEVAPALRAEDHALRGFQALQRNTAFGLAGRLKKDKTLDAADLYYVGFHFAEQAGEDKELGDAILAHVAKTWPRSEQGKVAKSRVKAEAAAKRRRGAS
jgi:hypothetical protein